MSSDGWKIAVILNNTCLSQVTRPLYSLYMSWRIFWLDVYWQREVILWYVLRIHWFNIRTVNVINWSVLGIGITRVIAALCCNSDKTKLNASLYKSPGKNVSFRFVLLWTKGRCTNTFFYITNLNSSATQCFDCSRMICFLSESYTSFF